MKNIFCFKIPFDKSIGINPIMKKPLKVKVIDHTQPQSSEILKPLRQEEDLLKALASVVDSLPQSYREQCANLKNCTN